jgi:hypothetical protein
MDHRKGEPQGLTKVQFAILDAMADGSEPFSMIYADVQDKLGTVKCVKGIAEDVCSLVSRGLISVVDAKDISAEALTSHYANLVQELEKGRPFYYSKGEYFFELTGKGWNAWLSTAP